MKLSNTFALAFRNYSIFLKSLCFKIFSFGLLLGVAYLTLDDTFGKILISLEEVGLLQKADSVFAEFNSSSFSATNLQKSILDFNVLLGDWIAGINLFYLKFSVTIVLLFLGVQIARFLGNLGEYSVCRVLTRFMSTSYRPPYYWTFFNKLKISVRLQLYNVFVLSMLNVFSFFGFLGLYLFAFINLGTWGLIISLFIWTLVLSYNRTRLAFFLPELVTTKKNVFSCLVSASGKIAKRFFKMYFSIFILKFFSMMLIVGVLMISTNMVTLLICIAIGLHVSFFEQCACMVEYFESQEMPYYTKKVKFKDAV